MIVRIHHHNFGGLARCCCAQSRLLFFFSFFYSHHSSLITIAYDPTSQAHIFPNKHMRLKARSFVHNTTNWVKTWMLSKANYVFDVWHSPFSSFSSFVSTYFLWRYRCRRRRKRCWIHFFNMLQCNDVFFFGVFVCRFVVRKWFDFQ